MPWTIWAFKKYCLPPCLIYRQYNELVLEFVDMIMPHMIDCPFAVCKVVLPGYIRLVNVGVEYIK